METYGPWKKSPRWRRMLGYPAYRRSVYASPYIGGGFDGWEFSDEGPHVEKMRELLGSALPIVESYASAQIDHNDTKLAEQIKEVLTA